MFRRRLAEPPSVFEWEHGRHAVDGAGQIVDIALARQQGAQAFLKLIRVELVGRLTDIVQSRPHGLIHRLLRLPD